jgi:predicted kinase
VLTAPGRPTLAIVSGPPGSGKTTLAHALSRAVCFPVISQDEIRSGLVHGAGLDDDRALRTFFGALELLAGSGVSGIAEAAYPDRLWQQALERLCGVAQVRLVRCVIDPEIARTRILPEHAARSDPYQMNGPPFEGLRVDGVTQLDVETTEGYRPMFDQIVGYVSGGHSPGRVIRGRNGYLGA